MLLAAAGFALIALIAGMLSLPGEYLPDDNIFELSHYKTLMVTFFQTTNALPSPYIERLYGARLTCLAVLQLIGVMLFCAASLNFLSAHRLRKAYR